MLDAASALAWLILSYGVLLGFFYPHSAHASFPRAQNDRPVHHLLFLKAVQAQKSTHRSGTGKKLAARRRACPQRQGAKCREMGSRTALINRVLHKTSPHARKQQIMCLKLSSGTQDTDACDTGGGSRSPLAQMHHPAQPWTMPLTKTDSRVQKCCINKPQKVSSSSA